MTRRAIVTLVIILGLTVCAPATASGWRATPFSMRTLLAQPGWLEAYGQGLVTTWHLYGADPSGRMDFGDATQLELEQLASFWLAWALSSSGSMFSGENAGGVGLAARAVSIRPEADPRMLQLSMVANVHAGNVRGIQGALGTNVAQDVSGIQIGLVNIGHSVSGAQIGLVNIARHVSGAQIGLVNVSRSMQGVPVGIVNLVGG
jgi:hypothetical protein